MSAVGLMLAAWALEVMFGWPGWLYKTIRHPVVWMGALVSALDRIFNRPALSHRLRYTLGAVSTVLVVASVFSVAWSISAALPDSALGYGIEALAASSLLASRSLYLHVHHVAKPLIACDMSTARDAVAQIVGRETQNLDGPAIARASLESLAENTSDGVVAPLFWGICFGLPGLAAYKAINTMDSMIGHKSERFRAFGGFAARLDDLMNYVPARLTGLILAISEPRSRGLSVMFADAKHHRSINAGWPEAAMAGALDVRLSGPRTYAGAVGDEPWLNGSSRDPEPRDVQRGIWLYLRALVLLGTSLIAWWAWSA